MIVNTSKNNSEKSQVNNSLNNLNAGSTRSHGINFAGPKLGTVHSQNEGRKDRFLGFLGHWDFQHGKHAEQADTARP
jgi:hypothetical protein